MQVVPFHLLLQFICNLSPHKNCYIKDNWTFSFNYQPSHSDYKIPSADKAQRIENTDDKRAKSVPAYTGLLAHWGGLASTMYRHVVWMKQKQAVNPDKIRHNNKINNWI